MNTEYLVLAVILFLVGVELWAYKDSSPNSFLITTVVKKYARKYPPLVFAAGFLAGHFFW